MRNEADGVVMLLRAEPERLCADFLKDFEKGGDTRVVGGGGFFRGGRSTGLKTRHYSGIGRFADQGIGGIAEKVGVGVGEAGGLPAGHGMATEAKRPRLP